MLSAHSLSIAHPGDMIPAIPAVPVAPTWPERQNSLPRIEVDQLALGLPVGEGAFSRVYEAFWNGCYTSHRNPSSGVDATICTSPEAGALHRPGMAAVQIGHKTGRAHSASCRASIRVAVKVLKPPGGPTAQDGAAWQRLLKEGQLLWNLSHRSIVGCYGWGQLGHDHRRHPSCFFLVQPLLSGQTLAEKVCQGSAAAAAAAVQVLRSPGSNNQLVPGCSYSSQEGLNWLVDVAEGLEHLHNSGAGNPRIIHRDIKLENIVLAHSGPGAKAVLVDLGLHRRVEGVAWVGPPASSCPTSPPGCFKAAYLAQPGPGRYVAAGAAAAAKPLGGQDLQQRRQGEEAPAGLCEGSIASSLQARQQPQQQSGLLKGSSFCRGCPVAEAAMPTLPVAVPGRAGVGGASSGQSKLQTSKTAPGDLGGIAAARLMAGASTETETTSETEWGVNDPVRPGHGRSSSDDCGLDFSSSSSIGSGSESVEGLDADAKHLSPAGCSSRLGVCQLQAVGQVQQLQKPGQGQDMPSRVGVAISSSSGKGGGGVLSRVTRPVKGFLNSPPWTKSSQQRKAKAQILNAGPAADGGAAQEADAAATAAAERRPATPIAAPIIKTVRSPGSVLVHLATGMLQNIKPTKPPTMAQRVSSSHRCLERTASLPEPAMKQAQRGGQLRQVPEWCAVPTSSPAPQPAAAGAGADQLTGSMGAPGVAGGPAPPVAAAAAAPGAPAGCITSPAAAGQGAPEGARAAGLGVKQGQALAHQGGTYSACSPAAPAGGKPSQANGPVAAGTGHVGCPAAAAGKPPVTIPAPGAPAAAAAAPGPGVPVERTNSGSSGCSGLGSEARYAMTGRVGSWTYMAPEVLMNQPYNEAVDVFSFGVVVYEVLARTVLLGAGAPPMAPAAAACWAQGSPAEQQAAQVAAGKLAAQMWACKVATGARPRLPALWPSPLIHLVEACWNQDPAQRPSMSSVAVVLRALRDNPHVAAQLDALHCPELAAVDVAALNFLRSGQRLK